MIRISALNSDAGEADLEWIKRLAPSPAAVMLPKAESASAVGRMHDQLDGVGLLPIVESAVGLATLSELSAARGVIRLAVGHIDFMADTGLQCDEMQSELAPLRFAVAMATRLNNLAPAIDGVTVQIDDEERVRIDTRRALRFGFGGKLCIHPRQVRVVHEAFAPNEQELEWARRVIAADATQVARQYNSTAA
ncbi:MAG: aldolase/citrate lyase family protein [Burkholderiaceae bacterium]